MQSNSDYDYSEFAPKKSKENQYDYSEFAPKKKREESSALGELFDPVGRFKMLLSATSSNPVQNAAAINEGVRRIGQNTKQAGLWAGNKLGLDTGLQEYTQELEKSHKDFGETPTGQSLYGRGITEATQMAPMVALPLGAGGSMIKKMLTGAAGLGAYEGLQYVPEGESRGAKIAKGATIGALFPPGLKYLEKAGGKALDILEPLFQGKFGEAARQANPWQLINKTDPNLTSRKQAVKSQIADIEEKLPYVSEKLAEVEPEVLTSQQAHYEASQDLKKAQKAAERSPYVGKSKETSIERDLANADLSLQDLNKARQETEAKINETTVPEPFEHDAKIADLEKSSQERQLIADEYEAQMKAHDAEFKAAQEKAQKHPFVAATTEPVIERKITAGEWKKVEHEKELAETEKEHAKNLQDEHKAEQEAFKATHEQLQARANMVKAESHIKAAENAAKATDHNISQYLGKGAEHDVDLAARVNAVQDAKHALATKKYTDLESKTEGIYIDHEKEKNVQERLNKIRKSLSKEDTLSPESRSFLKRLKNIESTGARVTAKEYLELLRTAKQVLRNARNKAFSVGMRADERAAWKEKYGAYDKLVDRMSRSLERGLGKENSKLLKEANATWREDVASLYNNPTYQRMKKTGTASDNVMKAIRGPAKGNVKLRQIILNDPVSIKHILGQRFANKPENLANIGVREKQYIDADPEFKAMVEQRNAANNMIESSKLNHKTAKEAHISAETKENKVHAAYNASKTLKGKTQKDLDNLNTAIAEIDKEQPELIKHRDELVRIAKNKETTLPKKLQAEKELKEVNEHLAKVKEEKVTREKEIKTLQDEIATHTEDLQNIQSKIAKIEEKIPHQQQALRDINEATNREQITFQEKFRLEKEKADLTKLMAKGDSDLRKLNNQVKILNGKIDKSRTGLYKYIKWSAKQIPRLYRWIKKTTP